MFVILFYSYYATNYYGEQTKNKDFRYRLK